MNTKIKRIIAYILTITLLVTMTGINNYVKADENIDQGKCGLKSSYVIDNEGILTISGSGKVTNKNWSSFKEQIKKVVVGEGVTELPYGAFSDHTNLTDVVMADSVRKIDRFTFDGCRSLFNVTLSKSLKEIPIKTFNNCVELKKIQIPDNITKINDEAFSNCVKLNNIVMSSNIEEVGNEVFDNTAFYNNSDNWTDGVLYCGSVVAASDENISGEIDIKEGTRVISDHAFEERKISGVSFPESMIRIGNNAFWDCGTLKSVIAKSGLKYIGVNTFYHNDLLKNVQLPDTVIEIGAGAFQVCIRLVSIKMPENLAKLGKKAFYGCASLESFEVPKSVAIIGENCFEGCEQLLEFTSHSTAYPGNYKDALAELKLSETIEKIRAIEGSAYEEYAKSKGITFEKVDDWQTIESENEYGKITVTKNHKQYSKNIIDNGKTYLDYANISNNSAIIAKIESKYYDQNEVQNILNGDLIKYFQTKYLYKDCCITIDLGKCISFDKIKLWICNTGLEYEINVSNDNIYFQRVMYVTNPCFNARTDELTLKENISARYIQINRLYDSGGSDYLYEVGVYGVEGQVEKTDEPETTTKESEQEITTTDEQQESTGENIYETTTDESESVTTTEKQGGESDSVTTIDAKDNEESDTTSRKQDYESVSTTEKKNSESELVSTTNSQNNRATSKAKSGRLAVPKIKRIKEKDYHTVLLEWSRSKDGCSYEIYRSEKRTGKYKRIATTSKLQYADKNIKSGKKYFYKIKAIEAGENLISSIKEIKVKGMPSKPSLKLKADSRALKIKWGIISDNSKGVEVYVKSNGGGYKKYTKIYATTNLKKSKSKKGATGIESPKSGMKKGCTYQFKIRTYAIVNRKKVYSKWSKVKKIKIK